MKSPYTDIFTHAGYLDPNFRYVPADEMRPDYLSKKYGPAIRKQKLEHKAMKEKA